MESDSILCPDCGWTGPEADLEDGEDGEDGGSCPVCDANVEFVE